MSKTHNKPYSPKIDIVIPIYGKFDFLRECLNAIPDSVGDIDYKVILVDDASPDKIEANRFFTAFEEENKFKSYEVARLSQNSGYPGACNHGASKGNSPIICILTTDVLMDKGSIKLLYNEMINDDTIGSIGPLLTFVENTPHGPVGKVQHAGLDMDVHGNVVHTFIGWDPKNPKVQKRSEVFALTGALFLTRRNLWHMVNGFSQDYGRGTYEDVEYALTIKSMGYKIIYEPKATGSHFVGASVIQDKKGYDLNRNKQILDAKCSRFYEWTQWKRW